MAIFRQLSAEYRGGIITDSPKSNRNPGPQLFIGLGGTGKDMVKALKREIRSCFKPDNPGSPVPEYRNLRYLVIDDDDSGLSRPGNFGNIDRQTEYFDLCNPNWKSILQSEESLKARKDMEWYNYRGIRIPEENVSGSCIRHVERFLLIDKASLFREKLASIIQEISRKSTENLKVHIFSGLSGSAGSGTFIDVCYIVRNILESLGRAKNYSLYGWFFMPDVYLSRQAISSTPLLAEYIKHSGYAALKELDYLMGLEEGQGRFRQEYQSFRIDTDKPPVDICNLISVSDPEGTQPEDGYEYGIRLVLDHVIAFLAKPVLTAREAVGMLPYWSYGMTDAAPRFCKAHGAVYGYRIPGAVRAELPFTDIHTYLGSRWFGSFDFMYGRTPDEAQMEEFIQKNQLTYEQLLEKLTEGLPSLVYIPEWLSSLRTALEENCRAMTEDLQDYNVSYEMFQEKTSLIAAIYASLYRDYARNSEYGPFFATNLLEGDEHKDLHHVISGYMEENRIRLETELRQNDVLRDNLLTAEERYQKSSASRLGNGFRSSRDYLEALNQYYLHLANIEAYHCMEVLLETLQKQIEKLNRDFFGVLTALLTDLKETFEENIHILSEKDAADTKTTGRHRILHVSDIREQLDEIIRDSYTDRTFRNFMQELFDQYHRWLSREDEKIAPWIANLIMSQLPAASSLSMQSLLQIRYGTTIPEVLTARIKQDLRQEIQNNTERPLFWSSPQFDMNEIIQQSAVFVPADVPEAVRAAEELAANWNISVYKTGLSDRILVVNTLRGLPLCAYQGITELEKAYESHCHSAGLFLYEGETVDWRRILPSPIPASFPASGHVIPRIEERNQSLLQEFEEAREAGIIYYDGVNWKVKLARGEAIQAQAEEPAHPESPQSLEDRITHLKDLRGHMYDPDQLTGQVTISTKGARPGEKEKILRDNYLRFPEIQALVQQELAGYRKICKAIEDLEAKLLADVKERNLKEMFFQAVCTGVIEIERTKILYRYQNGAWEETLKLSGSDMPYGTSCALYQAYLTFSELEEETCSGIMAQSADRLDHLQPADYEAVRKLLEFYSADRLRMIFSRIIHDPDREKIKDFYRDLVQALRSYLVLYRV